MCVRKNTGFFNADGDYTAQLTSLAQDVTTAQNNLQQVLIQAQALQQQLISPSSAQRIAAQAQLNNLQPTIVNLQTQVEMAQAKYDAAKNAALSVANTAQAQIIAEHSAAQTAINQAYNNGMSAGGTGKKFVSSPFGIITISTIAIAIIGISIKLLKK